MMFISLVVHVIIRYSHSLNRVHEQGGSVVRTYGINGLQGYYRCQQDIRRG